jgi:hypothetical protein
MRVMHVHKINISRGRECPREPKLLGVLARGVLGPHVHSGEHNVCSGDPSTMRLSQQVLGAHPLHGPGFALWHGNAVQAEGGGDDPDLDSLPSREDRWTLGFGLGTSRAGVGDLGVIKTIESALDAREALIDGMVGGCRADVVAGRRYRG